MTPMQVFCVSALVMTFWTIVLGRNIAMGGAAKNFSRRYQVMEDRNTATIKRTTNEEIIASNPSMAMGHPVGLPWGTMFNQDSYVTIFDPGQNFPFYSAYLIDPDQAKDIGKYTREQANDAWVEDLTSLENAKGVYAHNLNQGAENELQKGHMNPSYINSFDTTYMAHTFYLSNAAPQYKTSNIGDWSRYEGWLAKYAKEECAKHKGSMHIFTGTSNNYVGDTPDEEAPARMAKPPQIKQKPLTPEQILFQQKLAGHGKTFSNEPVNYPTIAIPRAIWTAACCVFGKKVIASMAVMTNNHWEQDKLQQTEMTVGQLQTAIKEDSFEDDVVIFPLYPDCVKVPLNKILSEMYDTE